MTPWDFDAWSARRRRARRVGYVLLSLVAISAAIAIGEDVYVLWRVWS